MTEPILEKRDRDKIRLILKENVQIKGSLPESRKAFDDSWMELIRNYKAIAGPDFNRIVVQEYLEEAGCSSHIIERFLKSIFNS